MAYIGKSPTGTGIRQRYYFTATGGETSLSGTDDNGLTMSYADGAYVDVNLNGIKLVSDTDYTTTTANTIGGLAALSANDIVEVVAYDIFTVADTVSAKNGGTFNGNVATTGNISAVDGSFSGDTAVAGDLTVDTNTLHVDSTNNRVGIGTSSPLDLVHIKETNGTATSTQLMLHNNNTGSGSAGIAFNVIHDGETTSYVPKGAILFERTATNGRGAFKFMSDNVDDTNPFSAGDEVMRIDSNGSVKINTTSTIHSNAILNAHMTESSGTVVATKRDTTSGARHIVFYNPNGEVGGILTSGSGTNYNTSSDYRLKENVTDITGATDRLKQLNPVRFNFIADANNTVDGFLAHEAQAVVPEAVTGTHNEVDDDGNAVYQGIDQSKLVPLLVATIQEQQAAIEALTARVSALEEN